MSSRSTHTVSSILVLFRVPCIDAGLIARTIFSLPYIRRLLVNLYRSTWQIQVSYVTFQSCLHLPHHPNCDPILNAVQLTFVQILRKFKSGPCRISLYTCFLNFKVVLSYQISCVPSSKTCKIIQKNAIGRIIKQLVMLNVSII